MTPDRAGRDGLPEGRLEGATFLLAGGTLAVASALFGLDAFTAVSAAASWRVLRTPPGYGLLLAGLVWLYPSMGDPAPRPARVGARLAGLSLAATAAVVLGALVSVGLGLDAPVPLAGPSATTVATVAAMAPLPVGVGLVGVAAVRTAVPSRAVGGLLLALAGEWLLALGTALSFRHEAAFPGWQLPLGASLAYGYGAALADLLVLAAHAAAAATALAAGFLLWTGVAASTDTGTSRSAAESTRESAGRSGLPDGISDPLAVVSGHPWPSKSRAARRPARAAATRRRDGRGRRSGRPAPRAGPRGPAVARR